MDPRDSLYYKMAIAHLKYEWPEKLEYLLKTGKLHEHLLDLEDKASTVEANMRRAYPGMNGSEIQEIAAKEWILVSNPDFDPDNPTELSPEGEKLLEEFESMDDEDFPESPPEDDKPDKGKITQEEYDNLITRSKNGEICFMYDAAQCKDFLLKLNNEESVSIVGNSLRWQSNVIRAIVYFLEPVSLLAAIASAFVWTKWWGLLITPAVFIFWFMLKSASSTGRQRIVLPWLVFGSGIAIAVINREMGLGFMSFMIAMSVLYLAERMLYALPVLFFSLLTHSNHKLVSLLYEKPIDDFNKDIGVPLMWYVETR